LLVIKVEADAALRQFDELVKNVAGIGEQMSATFVTWQTEDMHRHYPKVDGAPPAISTEIFPRSRLVRRRTESRSARRRSIIAAGRGSPTAGHRPILRPELFEKLCERMRDMMKEAATWQ
jgi:hypothetical protein